MNAPFFEIARRILIVEKVRPLRDVAHDMGMEYATLYSRVTGRSPFKPEEMTALIRHVPDIRLVDSLLNGTDFIAVDRIPENGWGNASEAMSAALKSTQQLIEVLLQLHFSKIDGAAPVAARHDIEAHVIEAERSLARLKLALPHLQLDAIESAA